jgi:hypothetical protein
MAERARRAIRQTATKFANLRQKLERNKARAKTLRKK